MSRSESLPTGRRVLRWIGWLGAGVAVGVLAGFLAGLGATAPGAPRGARSEAGPAGRRTDTGAGGDL